MSPGDMATDNINPLIQRVANQSIAEIERVIAELTIVRDMLRSEGERVQYEISRYASLSEAAMTSTKVIADSLAHWRAPSQQQTPQPRLMGRSNPLPRPE